MDKIIQILEELGLPYAYDHFAEGEGPDPPFLCFRCPNSDNFAADGTVYCTKPLRGGVATSSLRLKIYIFAASKKAALDGCGKVKLRHKTNPAQKNCRGLYYHTRSLPTMAYPPVGFAFCQQIYSCRRLYHGRLPCSIQKDA